MMPGHGTSLKWLLWGRKKWSLPTFDLTPACGIYSCTFFPFVLMTKLTPVYSEAPTGSPAVLRRFLAQFNYSLEHTADISLLPSNDPFSTSFNFSFLLPRPPPKLLFSVRAVMSVHYARRASTSDEWRNNCWMRARVRKAIPPQCFWNPLVLSDSNSRCTYIQW